jgi:hypothetical protein
LISDIMTSIRTMEALRPTGRAHTAAHPQVRNPATSGRCPPGPTRPLKAGHFAAFGVDLPPRRVAAGRPPGGVGGDVSRAARGCATLSQILRRRPASTFS